MAKLNGMNMYSFQYQYATRDVSLGISLPVSTAQEGANSYWIIMPMDTTAESSGDVTAGIFDPNPSVNGQQWSLLYGPCWFSITAAIGAGDVEPQASCHMQLADYEDDSETLLFGREAWEWFVGDLEGNTAHWTGAWHGYLSTGNRLRLRIDYWHADNPAKMNRAHVEGWYIRP
jgi:hypothetical protein